MTGAAYLADVSRTIGTKSIDMGGTVHENSDLEKLQGISGLSAQAGEFKLVSKGRQVNSTWGDDISSSLVRDYI
jgi:hypothetical protein